MFDAIAEFIHTIWKTDTNIRTSSALGESEHSRRYRKIFGVICIILITVCVILGIIYGI